VDEHSWSRTEGGGRGVGSSLLGWRFEALSRYGACHCLLSAAGLLRTGVGLLRHVLCTFCWKQRNSSSKILARSAWRGGELFRKNVSGRNSRELLQGLCRHAFFPALYSTDASAFANSGSSCKRNVAFIGPNISDKLY